MNWTKDVDSLINIIKQADVVVIDSYLADQNLYDILFDNVKLLVSIDDNKRLDYPDGVVVNGTVSAEEFGYPENNKIEYLLGTKYIPLRKSFQSLPSRVIKDEISKVLITLGSFGCKDLVLEILEILSNKYESIKFNIVVEQTDMIIDSFPNLVNENRINVVSKIDAGQMCNLMWESDICISAGGQTLYELAATGLPTIGICKAENQLSNLNGWQTKGFLEFVGWYNSNNLLNRICESFSNLKLSVNREKMSLLDSKMLMVMGYCE